MFQKMERIDKGLVIDSCGTRTGCVHPAKEAGSLADR